MVLEAKVVGVVSWMAGTGDREFNTSLAFGP
jgi:hypothetical protein